MRQCGITLLTGLLLFLAISCSQPSPGPLVPATDPATQADSDSQPRDGYSSAYLWGMWDIHIDPVNLTVDAVPIRTASFTCNVTRFIDGPPTNLSFTFGTIDVQPNYIDIPVDIGIRHPFEGMSRFTGFDVIGVFMGDGSGVYPGAQSFPVADDTNQRLLNPDGYTRWFNEPEFGGVTMPFLGYYPGALGSPGYAPSAVLNPYKYFTDSLGPDDDAFVFLAANPGDRGCFRTGSTNVRHYDLRFPTGGGIRFQYAVIGHWENSGFPDPSPQDFPPGANSDEALVIGVEDSSTVCFLDETSFCGSVILDISPVDWSAVCSGTMEEYAITCYSDAWIGGIAVDMNPIDQGDNYCTFHTEIPVESLSSADALPVWIETTYPDLDYSNEFGITNDAAGPLTSYFLVNIPVASADTGWAHTWGSSASDRGYATAVDSDGYACVTGYDSSPGHKDIFLARYSPCGLLLWKKTWGGTSVDTGYGVALDSSGDIHVVGFFMGPDVDFDPGPGSDPHTAMGAEDVFVSKFDSSGNFLWAQTFGAGGLDIAEGAAIDTGGNVFVAGHFSDTVDFDPGAGEDVHISNGYDDAFICAFDSSGNFLWAGTWGNEGFDAGLGVAVDGLGGVFVTGFFAGGSGGIVDFDPEAGVDEHSSNGVEDAFLSKYNSSGTYQWARTWGGIESDQGRGVSVDITGAPCVTGGYSGTVDFDPDTGVTEYTSNGDLDVFLSNLDSAGVFQWALAWGGPGEDEGYALAIDSFAINVTGGFSETVDFDPGMDTVERTSNGDLDIFLSRFDTSGGYEWSRSCGGENLDMGLGVGVDSSSNAFVAGRFRFSLDLAPTQPPCNAFSNMHTSHGACDVFLSKYLPDGCW